MRYYLDFDRTLFDTEAFIQYLRERTDAANISETGEMDVAAFLNRRVEEGSIQFAPNELTQFLFPDSASFLREKENTVTIITSRNPALQEAKVKSALAGIPRMSVMYTGEVRKGAYLAPHTHLHADAVLADDSPLELEVLASECPQLKLYEMRRDGAPGDGRWPIIQSLSDLP